MKQQSKSINKVFAVTLLTVLFVLSNGFINSANVSLAQTQENGNPGTLTPSIIATPSVLAIDPSNAANIYAGTFLNGVFKSTDSGASWRQVGLRGFIISTLTIDPANPNVIYASITPNGLCANITNHLFKSTNGGTSWQPLNTSQYIVGCNDIYSVAVAPSNPNVLYVANDGFEPYFTPASLLRSDDGGISFSGYGSPPFYQVVAVDPYDPYTVYGGARSSYTPRLGVIKSTDGGFTISTLSLSGYAISALTIDPFRRGTIYAAATSLNDDVYEVFQGLFKSVGGGPSPDGSPKWFAINSGLESLFDTRSLIRSVVIDPNNSNILYIGTSLNGVFRSTDGGANWTPFNVGLNSPYVSSLATTNGNPSVLYAVAGDGIFKFINNSWVRLPNLIVPPPPGPIINNSPKAN